MYKETYNLKEQSITYQNIPPLTPFKFHLKHITIINNIDKNLSLWINRRLEKIFRRRICIPNYFSWNKNLNVLEKGNETKNLKIFELIIDTSL